MYASAAYVLIDVLSLVDDNFKEEQKAAQSPTEYKQKMKFYRCLPQTELTSQGPQASNQMTKLQGLLKDKEAKAALRKPGLALKVYATCTNNIFNGV